MTEQDTGGGLDQAKAARSADDTSELKVKRGGGAVWAVLGIVLLIAVAGGGYYYFVVRGAEEERHERFRREVFGATHGQYFEAFWQCALTTPLSDYGNNQELTAKVLQNAGGGAATRYAEYLQKNENCLPLLEKAVPAYRALKDNPGTPAEYGPLLDKLADNLERVQSTWSEFAQYEAQAEKRADLVDRIKSRGTAYAGYEGAVEQNAAENLTKYQGNAVSYYQFVSCALGDTSYTSFVTEGDVEGPDSAHARVVSALDNLCASKGAEFVSRLDKVCGPKLYPAAPPEPDEAFKAAVTHWLKQGGDYGSAEPLWQCLNDADEDRTKELVGQIAQGWYDYTKTYREIYELAKSKSPTIFERGR